MAVFGKAQYIKRVEDDRLLTGNGGFSDNLSRPNQVHVVLVRSPQAHARIVKIDAEAARKAPGVVAVYSWADMEKEGSGYFVLPAMFPNADGTKPDMTPRRPLAHEVVRYVGEPVVAVVADTRAQAADAAELVEIEYDQLPSVTEIDDALKPDAPQVWKGAPGNRVGFNRFGDSAKADAAFAAAAHKCRDRHRAPAADRERDGAARDHGRMGRRPHGRAYRQPEPLGARATSCATSSSRCRKDKVRVLVRDIGGGFGMRTGIQPDELVAVWVAKVLKRPVKWRAERSEEFASATAGRDQLHKMALALDKDGRILALRMEAFANVGAYPSGAGIAIPLFVGPKVSTGTYVVPLVDFKITCVLTNTATIGAYRGAGRPECLLDLERLMDTASRQIGIDPAELRRRNFVTPAQMPYTTAMGEKYDTGDFDLFLTKTLEAADWDGFPAARPRPRSAASSTAAGSPPMSNGPAPWS